MLHYRDLTGYKKSIPICDLCGNVKHQDIADALVDKEVQDWITIEINGDHFKRIHICPDCSDHIAVQNNWIDKLTILILSLFKEKK